MLFKLLKEAFLNNLEEALLSSGNLGGVLLIVGLLLVEVLVGVGICELKDGDMGEDEDEIFLSRL